MSITLTQIFLSIFLFFALSRVFLRLKSGELTTFSFFFWCFVFGTAIILVLFPGLSGKVAATLGIGRGVDVVIYVSIVLLFYLVFRLYIYLEDLKREITQLISNIALKDDKKKNEQKMAKD